MAGRTRGSKNARFHVWEPEQRAFMVTNVHGRSHREVTALVNERFGLELTVDQVKAFISRTKLNTGHTGRFEKGSVPANKGTKGMSHGSSTSFKPGNVAANRVPLGSIKRRVDGYTYVKIADGRKNANWKQLHIWLWEQENGPLPADHVLIFANGDRDDVRLDNLVLAERADLAVMNHSHLMGCDPLSMQAGVLTAKVIRRATSRRLERSAR